MAWAGYAQHMYSDSSTRRCPYTANIDRKWAIQNERLLDNFMDNLFKVTASHFTKHGRLRPSIERYLAAILINRDKIRTKYGTSNYVLRMTERCALILKINVTVLKDWWNITRDNRLLHNTQLKVDDIDSLLIIKLFRISATLARQDHIEILKI